MYEYGEDMCDYLFVCVQMRTLEGLSQTSINAFDEEFIDGKRDLISFLKI